MANNSFTRAMENNRKAHEAIGDKHGPASVKSKVLAKKAGKKEGKLSKEEALRLYHTHKDLLKKQSY